MRVKALQNTNSVASRHIKRENASTPTCIAQKRLFAKAPYLICLSTIPRDAEKKFVVLEKIL